MSTAQQGAPQARRDVLIVPDPNVRVQAVINGQGVALWDELVCDEFMVGKLHRLSDVALPDYGYFIVRSDRAKVSEQAEKFADWLQDVVSARSHSSSASAPRDII